MKISHWLQWWWLRWSSSCSEKHSGGRAQSRLSEGGDYSTTSLHQPTYTTTLFTNLHNHTTYCSGINMLIQPHFLKINCINQPTQPLYLLLKNKHTNTTTFLEDQLHQPTYTTTLLTAEDQTKPHDHTSIHNSSTMYKSTNLHNRTAWKLTNTHNHITYCSSANKYTLHTSTTLEDQPYQPT